MKSKVNKRTENVKDKSLNLSQLLEESKNVRVPKFGVSFFERSEKTVNNRSVIYISATFQGRNYKKSLSITCKSGGLNTKTLTVTGEDEISKLIQSIRNRIIELVTNFRITGKKIEPQKIVDSVLTQNGLIDKTPDVNQICSIILQEAGQKHSDGQLSTKAFNRYKLNIDRLQGFLYDHFKLSFIELSEVNQYTVEKYVSWLKHEYSFEPETIRKAIQVGKMIYRIAQKNRWYEYNPFDFVRLSRVKSSIQNHLTIEEIESLRTLNLSNKIYDDIRDIFIFQCFTSLAYTDVRHLKKIHIVEVDGSQIIRKAREKTNNVQVIFLFPEALAILEKHNGRNPIYCFECYSNTHHNRVLKELSNLAGIKKPISTHWGRKSFGQLMIKSGMTKEALQAVFAHSSVRITEKHYVNTSEKRALDEMKSITLKLK